MSNIFLLLPPEVSCNQRCNDCKNVVEFIYQTRMFTPLLHTIYRKTDCAGRRASLFEPLPLRSAA